MLELLIKAFMWTTCQNIGLIVSNLNDMGVCSPKLIEVKDSTAIVELINDGKPCQYSFQLEQKEHSNGSSYYRIIKIEKV